MTQVEMAKKILEQGYCKGIQRNGNIIKGLVYLPLGQSLTGEWLEMGEWV
jgi:hypothetical protein